MTGETVKKCPFKEGEVRLFAVFYRNIQFFRKGFGPLRRSGLSLISIGSWAQNCRGKVREK